MVIILFIPRGSKSKFLCIAKEIMEKLLKIPYFKAGYEVDGIKDDDFVSQPAFQYTANEFSGSMKFIESYVVERKKLVK